MRKSRKTICRPMRIFSRGLLFGAPLPWLSIGWRPGQGGLSEGSGSSPCEKHRWSCPEKKGVCSCSWLQYLFTRKEDNDICNYFSNELFAPKSLKIHLTLEVEGFPIVTLGLLRGRISSSWYYLYWYPGELSPEKSVCRWAFSPPVA